MTFAWQPHFCLRVERVSLWRVSQRCSETESNVTVSMTRAGAGERLNPHPNLTTPAQVCDVTMPLLARWSLLAICHLWMCKPHSSMWKPHKRIISNRTFLPRN